MSGIFKGSTNMVSEVHVGIADIKIGKEPTVLITLGLGSCVGVALYDPIQKVGGLLHVMLPKGAEFGKKVEKPAKFADLGVPYLMEEVLRIGGNRWLLDAKIAGGAQMFRGADSKFQLNIGERNIAAVKEALDKLGIRIVSDDVGGNGGRTMILDTATGAVTIRRLGSHIRVI